MKILLTRRAFLCTASSLCTLNASIAESDIADQRKRALEAMKRAATFYRSRVATHGGYVYHYSVDLKRRWGEGEATMDQIWVQCPGTPEVGGAFLAAYQATKDPFYLDAATSAGEALAYGQLRSGGWTHCIDFDPRGSQVALYRNGKGRGKDNSSLDDGKTQKTLTFLLKLNDALDSQHATIDDATRLGMQSLLSAQLPNGGFPQNWTYQEIALPMGASFAGRQANYPGINWATEGKVKEYWTLPTLNDNLAPDVFETLKTAHRMDPQGPALAAIERLGEFLLLAQMPDPQPAWAQQYNMQMQPTWARKFEPPAITGFESQGIVNLLMDIHDLTGNAKYVQTVPKAIDYLRRSTLLNGKMARYYELRTNRPLYMKRRGDVYSLTYDDDDLPEHYGWSFPSRVDELQMRFDAIGTPKMMEDVGMPREDLSRKVGRIIDGLDEQGRWVDTAQAGERLIGALKLPPETRYLSSQTFSDNIRTLSHWVA